jgi:hypothetical protein
VSLALRQRALASSTLTDLIGDRFYARYAPQGAPKPYVTARRISSRPEGHLGGGAQMFADRWQLETWATTVEQCESVTDALRVALDGFRGLSADTYIGACLLLNEVDDADTGQDGSEAKTHWTAMDFEVWHRRDRSGT